MSLHPEQQVDAFEHVRESTLGAQRRTPARRRQLDALQELWAAGAPQQGLGAGPLPAAPERAHQRGVRAHIGADAGSLHPVHHLLPQKGKGW